MTTAEQTSGAVPGAGREAGRDLVGSLAGLEANRESAVGYQTRRVVLASMGVIADQKAGRKRTRSLALAAILLIIMLLSPLIWSTADSIVAGGRFTDLPSEFGVWIMFLGAALLACVLLAGWLRSRP
ncbi:MAG TPA: hypothetical protein VFU55_08205 [Terracidiphilus sp.]|nr:hypothetical protein [Terracidiphilus sp.]